MIQFVISPRKVVQILVYAVLSLIVLSVTAQFLVPRIPPELLKTLRLRWIAWQFTVQFTLDNELSVPTWYSSAVLLVCAILLLVIFAAKKHAGDRYARHWLALSILFALISVDETAAIREQAMVPLRAYLKTGGIFYYAWVIPATVFVLLIGLVFARFLRALPAPTRRLFLLAGAVYVGGALGMEMVGGYYLSFPQRLGGVYRVITIVEEVMEMTGQVIFVYALLSYLSAQFGEVRIRFVKNGNQETVPVSKSDRVPAGDGAHRV